MEATFSPVYAVGAGLSQADPEVFLLTDIVQHITTALSGVCSLWCICYCRGTE